MQFVLDVIESGRPNSIVLPPQFALPDIGAVILLTCAPFQLRSNISESKACVR